MSTLFQTCEHLVDLLRYRAEETPNKPAYKYLMNGEEAGRFTYKQLDQKAKTVAYYLKKNAVKPGDRVMLIYPPGIEFISSFFGCLYAGAIAVPSVPPNKYLQRLESIMVHSRPSLNLTSAKLLKGIRARFKNEKLYQNFAWIATDELPGAAGEDIVDHSVTGDSIAFLQYTSGSTGTPKGVMVSHSNLLHNSNMLQQASQNDTHSVIINWLPLYHDMGIVGSILQPLYAGATCITMSPLDFLQKPYRWLKAITDYQGTYSGAPDFGFKLCVDKVTEEQRSELNLSSWDTAFNGSDVVRHSTLESFSEKFAPNGFRREAFYPTYGLAESTLMVTGRLKEDPPRYHSVFQENTHTSEDKGNDTLKRVSLGEPWLGQKLIIVDPDTFIVCKENKVGEVWISGESVAAGYWNNPQTTEETFHAYTADGDGPYLRTGDLGYMKDQELYFKGRIKDLIIIRGKNHYPQDVEHTVENSCPDLVSNGIAAFSIEDQDEEKLIVAVEVNRNISYEGGYSDVKKKIMKLVRRAIAEEHEVQLHELILIAEGGIPKTSSGKVQRKESREGYINETLNIWNMDV